MILGSDALRRAAVSGRRLYESELYLGDSVCGPGAETGCPDLDGKNSVHLISRPFHEALVIEMPSSLFSSMVWQISRWFGQSAA